MLKFLLLVLLPIRVFGRGIMARSPKSAVVSSSGASEVEVTDAIAPAPLMGEDAFHAGLAQSLAQELGTSVGTTTLELSRSGSFRSFFFASSCPEHIVTMCSGRGEEEEAVVAVPLPCAYF